MIPIFSLAASAASYELVANHFWRCSTRAIESGHSQCLGNDAHYLLVVCLGNWCWICLFTGCVFGSGLHNTWCVTMYYSSAKLHKSLSRFRISHSGMGGVTTDVVSFILLRWYSFNWKHNWSQYLFPKRWPFWGVYWLEWVYFPSRVGNYEHSNTLSVFSIWFWISTAISVKEQHMALDVPLWVMPAANCWSDNL